MGGGRTTDLQVEEVVLIRGNVNNSCEADVVFEAGFIHVDVVRVSTAVVSLV
jgi:hypothetical protein